MAIFAHLFINKNTKMPIKLNILPYLALICGLVTGCGEHTPRHIDRLDVAIADSAAVLQPGQQKAIDEWLGIFGPGATLAGYRSSKAVKVFSPIVAEDLPALDSVESVLGYALSKIGDTDSQLFGIIIPNTQSVVTTPSGTVLIGLNHYLGADNKIYSNFPEFMRSRKCVERMPVDVMQAVIAQKHPAELSEESTLLNTMLYQGALLEATRCALPDETSDVLVLGMTPEEYEWSRKFEERVWKTLIERKLLYSTDSNQIRLLTSPAPHSTIINANAPGQVVLFLGMQIARSYLAANPDKSIDDLLLPSYYNDNSSLVKSNYNPSNATD